MIEKFFLALRRLCLGVAIAATFTLFIVVAFNIVGRAVFDATGGDLNLMIFGAIELSQYALMISIFASIPAMLGTGLIKVDIVSQNFPHWLQKSLDKVWLSLIALFAAVLAIAFFELAVTALNRGDETQDLRLPLWPFYAVACFECAALFLLAGAEMLGLVHPPKAETS